MTSPAEHLAQRGPRLVQPNLLLNGNFEVNQEAWSSKAFGSATPDYTVDQWVVYSGGNGTLTAS